MNVRALSARAVAAAAILLGSIGVSAPPAAAATAPVTITIDAIGTGGRLVGAKNLPTAPGQAAQYLLNAHLRIRNTGSSPVTVTGYTLTYAGSPHTDTTDFTIAPGETRYRIPERTWTGAFPMPTSASAQITFSGYDTVNRSVAVGLQQHQTPTGAYRFPAKATDLPTGHYWMNWNDLLNTRHHHGNPSQTYAYDFLVGKWDGSQWNRLRSGTTGDTNDDYLIWGTPVYAMDDGVILECRRTFTDNVPGTYGVAGGNHLTIRHGNGEVALYAHFRAGSVSSALCPTESKTAAENGGTVVHAQPIAVRAGQMLGRVGNTGSSSEPHLHVHLQKYAPYDWKDEGAFTSAPGLPLNFDRIEGRKYDGYTPPASGIAALTSIPEGSGHVVGPYSIVKPNPCGWDPPLPGRTEVTLYGISSKCFQERFNDVVRVGYRPVAIDGFTVGGAALYNATFRPNRPATVAFASLTAAQFQTQFDTLTGQGYRLIHADEYVLGSGRRFSATYAQESGPGWVAYHGVSAAAHQDQFDSLVAGGYRPRVISVSSLNGTETFTAIYVQENVGGFVAELSDVSSFQSLFNTRTGQGLRPIYVDAFNDAGTARYSVIWTTAASSSYLMQGELTTSTVQSTTNQQRAAGRLTRAVAGYQNGAAIRYVAIWR